MIDVFAGVLNIKPSIAERMRKRLERLHGNLWRWEQFDIAKMAPSIDVPILVGHDRDDLTIPYSQAEAIIAALPNAVLVTTEKNGHRNIVRDDEVIARAVRFIASNVAAVSVARGA